VSFDLGVLAIDGWTDVAEVIAMVDRCNALVHVEGELDQRIVGFYERLRARFPDHGPDSDADENPWMSTPLDVGIDHVFMCVTYSDRGHPALAMIRELATEYGLTIWDPQDGSAHRPVREPSREGVALWWGALLEGRRSRDEIHEYVRPWIEEPPETIDDPITWMGLQQLYGLTDDRSQNDTDAGALFEKWLAHGERFDADPDRWQHDRLVQSVQAIRREQGPERARALAMQLMGQGQFSPEDVIHILGSVL
jgi:hypothetical protein